MEVKTITIPKIKSTTFEYSLISLAFLIPFFISGPQLLTGTIVNSLLYLFALCAYSKKLLPLIVLPSIGALLNGVVFGTFSVFLLYFLPFIWMGNYILVFSCRLILRNNSLIVSVVGSALIKSLFLFLVAYVFVTSKVVPVIFLQFMGLFQLATALIGGILADTINTLFLKNND